MTQVMCGICTNAIHYSGRVHFRNEEASIIASVDDGGHVTLRDFQTDELDYVFYSNHKSEKSAKISAPKGEDSNETSPPVIDMGIVTTPLGSRVLIRSTRSTMLVDLHTGKPIREWSTDLQNWKGKNREDDAKVTCIAISEDCKAVVMEPPLAP